MDYETKIYLDKLVGAVEKLDSPDWWTIGITSAMTAIMAWIAWNQYKLQKRQAALQAYESYKPTYELFLSIQKMANTLIYKIAYHCTEDAHFKHGKGWVDDTLEELQKVEEELYSKETQIEMQLSSIGLSLKEYSRYSLLVKSMFYLVEKIAENEDIILLNNVEYQDVLTEGTSYLLDRIQQEIDSGDTDKEPLKSFNRRFRLFVKCREDVIKDTTMSIIKKKCKID